MIRRPPRSTLFPTRRSSDLSPAAIITQAPGQDAWLLRNPATCWPVRDRKSTRLNSSHMSISYAVFCLKKKKKKKQKIKIQKNKQQMRSYMINHIQEFTKNKP